MATFSVFRRRSESAVPSFELADFNSGAEARRYAREVLAGNPRYESIEVMDNGTGRVELITRGATH